MSGALKVIVFPGVQNLPSFAAEAQGLFKKHSVAPELVFTTSSGQQRGGLADGTYQIAHGAVDNAVAMVDVAGVDVEILCGLDHGFNKLMVRPEITSFEALRGKTLGVDAPDTAFALVAFDVLARKGLPRGSYTVQKVGATRFRLEALRAGTIDFAMLNLPFNLFAQRAGLAVLDDPASTVGPYQSTGAFVLRSWAAANRAVLVGYLAAYIEGLRWVLDPANRAMVVALLQQQMDLPQVIAAQCFDQVSQSPGGFVIDALLNRPGMAKVLSLRAAFNCTSDVPPVERYVDESVYEEALFRLNGGIV